MKLICYLFVLLLLIFLDPVYAQTLPDGYGYGLVDKTATCTSYIGDPIDQPLCNNRLPNDKTIYTTGSNFESQYEAQETIGLSFLNITFLQNQCTDLLFTQFGICDIYLAPCTIVPTPAQNVTLPMRFCKSSCERMVSSCPILGSLMDCSNPLIFPELGTFYSLLEFGYTDNNGFYVVPCTDPTTTYNEVSQQTNLIEICPTPLLLKNSSDSKYSSKRGYTYLSPTNCVLPCPIPYYKKEKLDKLLLMSRILSTISFVLSLYNILTFGILNKNLSNPQKCICFFSGSIALVNLCDIITYGVGYDKFLCPEAGRAANQTDDPACGFLGSLFHFGISYCVLWSATLAVVLVATIKRLKVFNFNYYLAFNTCFPIITLVIALSAKKVEVDIGGIECWMKERWYTISLFWIPCAIALTVGLICVLIMIYEIFITSRRSKNNINDLITREIKLLLIVVFICGSFMYLLIFYLNQESNMDQYKSSAEEYVLCLLTGMGEDCLLDSPSFGTFFFFYLIIRYFGIIFFLFYGTSALAREIWSDSKIYKRITSSFSSKSSSKISPNVSVENQSSNLESTGVILNDNSSKNDNEKNIIELESIERN